MTFQLTVFAQIMQLLEHHTLNECIVRYEGDYRSRSFSCLDQFLCMIFGQLAHKKSLRATVFSLRQMKHKLYHMGIKGRVTLSALADANYSRDWRIWQDHAQSLIERATALYQSETIKVDEDIATAVYAFDSSTVALCLSVFPWADFRSTKAGIKLHTQLNLRGAIPVYPSLGKRREST